jgi:predicted O-methyltransferase YrrM
MVNFFFNTVELIKAMASYQGSLSRFFGVAQKDIEVLYAEIYASAFFTGLKKKVDVPASRYYISMVSPFRAPLLYVACRLAKPEIIVETGVRDGFSSAFILSALQKNGSGKLYSIDLPNRPGHELEADQHTGWLIPDEYKRYWTLILGSSREKLPVLLAQLRTVDIFFHDSDHSYENMMFEFNQAWKCIKPGGYLLSDDITDNSAFDEFIGSHDCTASIRLFKTGVARRA